MADITALLAKLRGRRRRPPHPWDSTAGGRAHGPNGRRSAAASPGGPPARKAGSPGRSRLEAAPMKARCMGAGCGAPRSRRCSATPGPIPCCAARRPQLAEAINELHENPDYLPGIALTAGAGRDRDPAEALDGADLVVLRRARPDAARRICRTGRRCCRRGAAGQPDEGHRARHPPADERGDRRGDRRRGPDADRRGVRARTWPGRSPAPARRDRGRLPRRAPWPTLQQACHTPYFRPYTNPT